MKSAATRDDGRSGIRSDLLVDLAKIQRVSQEIATSHSPALKVVGVLLGAGGSDYVELLINIEGCWREPCQLQIGVFRNISEATLKHELSAKLREHLESHPAA